MNPPRDPGDLPPRLIAALAVDQQLAERVRRAGRGSAEYRWLEMALRDAGTGALTKMNAEGRLVEELARRGIELHSSTPSAYPECVPVIIVVAGRVAAQTFMLRQILDGAWSPSMGTTVESGVVSLCCRIFAEHYNRFCRDDDVSA